MPRRLFDDGEKMQLQYSVRNTHRAIGTRLASKITRQFGMTGLNPGHVTIRMRGSAGQSLGAFAVQGHGDWKYWAMPTIMSERVFPVGVHRGSADDRQSAGLQRKHDYRQHRALWRHSPVACSRRGRLASGFACEIPGPCAVVEGCGSNACEYMTGGEAVDLGLGRAQLRRQACRADWPMSMTPKNPCPNASTTKAFSTNAFAFDHWEERLKALIAEHCRETHSIFAATLLNDWRQEGPKFWQIVPREMIGLFDQPVVAEADLARA